MKKPPHPTKPRAPEPNLPSRDVSEELSWGGRYVSMTFKDIREKVEDFSRRNGVPVDDIRLIVEVSDGGTYGDDPYGEATVTLFGRSLGPPDPEYATKLVEYEKRMTSFEEKMKDYRRALKEYEKSEAERQIQTLEQQRDALEKRLQKLRS